MVLMEFGMYHKKLWILRDGRSEAAIHGSGNATSRGLLVNGEQMSLDRPWNDGPIAAQRVAALSASFERQWEGRDPRSLTVKASQALEFLESWGLEQGGKAAPTVEDFFHAWTSDHQTGKEQVPPTTSDTGERLLLTIPPNLDFRSGQYAHQGQAVDALLAEGGGILAIATGGGKTRTALIAAKAFQDLSLGPNIILVVVPSRPLVHQWADEIREFGIEPIILSHLRPPERKREFEFIAAAVRSSRSDTFVLLCTSAMFSRENGFNEPLRTIRHGSTFTLIADEVHNLGAPNTVAYLPEEVKWRIGLSATPVRQYDQSGTEGLYRYFGREVFEFSVTDAISSGCLVPYKYFPHIVEFDEQEIDEFETLSDRIRKLGFAGDLDDGPQGAYDRQVELLLRRRRALVEQARGKLAILRDLIAPQTGTLRRTLFYCSAKQTVLGDRRQIDHVNTMLLDLGIMFHQLTSQETQSDRGKEILSAFLHGDLQALTAMKVLDEGIDVPQTETAFILASSSVRREWVQRRGRVLRRAPGKVGAVLHDFVVSPAGLSPPSSSSLLKSEVARVEAFGADAKNQYDEDGSAAAITKLEEYINRRD